MSDVTHILSAIDQGDPAAAEQLLPLVYEELRRLAAQKLSHEKPGQTLQATALVHEAYLRLVDAEKAEHWDSRGHFFAAAAEAMRRILVETRSPQADARSAAVRSASGFGLKDVRQPEPCRRTSCLRSTRHSTSWPADDPVSSRTGQAPIFRRVCRSSRPRTAWESPHNRLSPMGLCKGLAVLAESATATLRRSSKKSVENLVTVAGRRSSHCS